MSEAMTDTKDEALSEDEKAERLKKYRHYLDRYNETLSEMKAKGYLIEDEKRARDRAELYDRLCNDGSALNSEARSVESWYGLEYVEENSEVYLRSLPPEKLAEWERKQRESRERAQANTAEWKRKLAAGEITQDEFDDYFRMPF